MPARLSWEYVRRTALRASRSRRLLGALVAAALVGKAGPSLIGVAIVRHASSMGASLSFDSAWPSFRGVSLHGARIQVGDKAGMLACFPALRFEFNLNGIGVRAEGGAVHFWGELRELRRLLRSRATDEGNQGRGSGKARALSFSGVEVVFDDPSTNSKLKLSGFALLGSTAQGKVEVQDAHVLTKGLEASASGASGTFERRRGDVLWSDVSFESLSLRPLAGEAATQPNEDPELMGISAEETPSWPERLKLRALRAAHAVAMHLEVGSGVRVHHLSLHIQRGEEQLHLGGGELTVVREAAALAVDLRAGGATPAIPIAVSGKLPLSDGDGTLSWRGGPLSLSALGIEEGNFGLTDLRRAQLDTDGELVFSATSSDFRLRAQGQLQALSLTQPRLARDTIHDLRAGFRFSSQGKTDGSILQVDDAELRLGAVQLSGSATLALGRDSVRADVHAKVPRTDCQTILRSLPQALVPRVHAMSLSGKFGLSMGVTFDTRAPEEVEVEWNMSNGCRVSDVPREIDSSRFEEPFLHTVYDAEGRPVEIETGPGTPDWVPLTAISPYLEAAVTTTEDGGFRKHGGFDKGAIRNSIRDDLVAGRFIRGASTISMQLAKNLYLEREKNLSRKLQEALLTLYLEQALSKDRILELYFNSVEFGPMVYGVGQAAEYYFDTLPFDLSLPQAVFLSSILPAPKRTYFDKSGQLSAGWSSYLRRVMKIMLDRHKITEVEYREGCSEVLVFHTPHGPKAAVDRSASPGLPAWLRPEGP